jgi:hypothetical protein
MDGFEMEDFVPFLMAGVAFDREPCDSHIKLPFACFQFLTLAVGTPGAPLFNISFLLLATEHGCLSGLVTNCTVPFLRYFCLGDALALLMEKRSADPCCANGTDLTGNCCGSSFKMILGKVS